MALLSVRWADETIELSADRAVHWPRGRTVLVADVHLGKAAAFRRAGVPVPPGTTRRNLHALGALVDRTGAERLVVLGDLLHARAGRTPALLDAVSTWRRARRQLEMVLVRGNHDERAGDPPADWDVRCVDEPWPHGPFALRHHPAPADGDGRSIAGHVHPVVTLRDADGTRMRLPCFRLGRRGLDLPAFGAFTGGHRIEPETGERIFVVGPGAVVEVSAACARGAAPARTRPGDL